MMKTENLYQFVLALVDRYDARKAAVRQRKWDAMRLTMLIVSEYLGFRLIGQSDADTFLVDLLAEHLMKNPDVLATLLESGVVPAPLMGVLYKRVSRRAKEVERESPPSPSAQN